MGITIKEAEAVIRDIDSHDSINKSILLTLLSPYEAEDYIQFDDGPLIAKDILVGLRIDFEKWGKRYDDVSKLYRS